MNNNWKTSLLALLVGCGSVQGSMSPDASGADSAPEIDANSVTCPDDCALGCHATEGRCNGVDPSNGLASALDDAANATELVLVGEATIDTDAGTITDTIGAKSPLTQTLTSSPVPVFVVIAKSIATNKITVTGSRALALVADGIIAIDGHIAVDAKSDVAGPGAMLDEVGCRGGNSAQGTSGSPGAGGGGFGSAGGAGGSGGKPAVAGATGGAVSGNLELAPLRGGCPGGHPGGRTLDTNANASDPGAGGGAIQIVSNTSIRLGADGFISANGGGGKGSSTPVFCVSDGPCGDGEGGGSGGGILLEAPVVEMAGTSGLTANGGAGSCATQGAASNGLASERVALGQRCSGDTGDGGNGAASANGATNGGDGSGTGPVGGGGGGGAGRIRVNLPAGATFVPGGVASPAASVGLLGVR
ncbi:MAG: hypothetical protein ACKV2T_26455 [Kofleriaceae bacterium]